MNKQINIKNLKKTYTFKKIDTTINKNKEDSDIYDEKSNISTLMTQNNSNKFIDNSKAKHIKKSYTNLIKKEKNISNNDLDMSNNNIDISNNSSNFVFLQDLFDNYIKQYECICKLYNSEVFKERKLIIQELKKKHVSYKQQDIKKDYHECENFITLDNIIEKLYNCNMKCYYCNCNTLILFKNSREENQWTLDRLNNYDEHSNENTIICCLKCNLQRRRKNSEKFKFTKQLENNILLLKKLEAD